MYIVVGDVGLKGEFGVLGDGIGGGSNDVEYGGGEGIEFVF